MDYASSTLDFLTDVKKHYSNCLICNEDIVAVMEHGHEFQELSEQNVKSICALLKLPILEELGLELGSDQALLAYCPGCLDQIQTFNVMVNKLNDLIAEMEGLRQKVKQKIVQSDAAQNTVPYVGQVRHRIASELNSIPSKEIPGVGIFEDPVEAIIDQYVNTEQSETSEGPADVKEEVEIDIVYEDVNFQIGSMEPEFDPENPDSEQQNSPYKKRKIENTDGSQSNIEGGKPENSGTEQIIPSTDPVSLDPVTRGANKNVGDRNANHGKSIYKCVYCRKTCRRLCHLRLHMKVHREVPLAADKDIPFVLVDAPYQCSIGSCGEPFKTLKTKKAHEERVHSAGVAIFRCTHAGCELYFMTEDWMEKHKMVAHSSKCF